LNIIENEGEKDKKLEQGTAYTSDALMRRDKVNKLGPVEQKCGRRETRGLSVTKPLRRAWSSTPSSKKPTSGFWQVSGLSEVRCL